MTEKGELIFACRSARASFVLLVLFAFCAFYKAIGWAHCYSESSPHPGCLSNLSEARKSGRLPFHRRHLDKVV